MHGYKCFNNVLLAYLYHMPKSANKICSSELLSLDSAKAQFVYVVK